MQLRVKSSRSEVYSKASSLRELASCSAKVEYVAQRYMSRHAIQAYLHSANGLHAVNITRREAESLGVCIKWILEGEPYGPNGVKKRDLWSNKDLALRLSSEGIAFITDEPKKKPKKPTGIERSINAYIFDDEMEEFIRNIVNVIDRYDAYECSKYCSIRSKFVYFDYKNVKTGR